MALSNEEIQNKLSSPQNKWALYDFGNDLEFSEEDDREIYSGQQILNENDNDLEFQKVLNSTSTDSD